MIQAKNKSGKIIEIPATALDDFKSTFEGTVLTEQDNGYEEARIVWNGMINRKPALIAKCSNGSDIQKAISFVREHQIRLSVRGGGHHVAGSAVQDQALMVDLSEMKDIDLNLENKTAKVQPGVTWGELDAKTQMHGLAVPGGVVSTTGIAGLTLGGGIGWLRGKYGLSCDNLLSVEMITSQSELLQVSEQLNPDLFWALRGGGGNCGIVSSFEYRLREAGPEVMFCLLFYPAAEAKKLMRFYRDTSLPQEVSTFILYGTVPGEESFPKEWQGEDAVIFAAMYAGSAEDGKKILQPFRELATPIVDFSDVMNYTDVQMVFDEDYPKNGLNYYWKSLFFDELTDEVIDKYIELGKSRPSPLTTVDIWGMGGAVDKVGHAATAYPHRNAKYLLAAESNWEKSGSDEENVRWTKKAIEEFLPLSGGKSYLNFEETEQTQNPHGEHQKRLKEIQQKYDPEGFFSQ